MTNGLRPRRCRGCDQPISETCKVCGLPAFDDLRARLQQVERERDAAVHNLEQAVRAFEGLRHSLTFYQPEYYAAIERAEAAEGKLAVVKEWERQHSLALPARLRRSLDRILQDESEVT